MERERDEKSPFLPDSRRGYARVTPVAQARNGIPGLGAPTLDQYPRDGIGIYDDLETSDQFSGWSDWTTKTVQPMHINEALKAMIDQPARSGAGDAMPSFTKKISLIRTHLQRTRGAMCLVSLVHLIPLNLRRM